MSREELSKLTIEEIEEKMVKAIKSSHIEFLTQLSDENSKQHANN